MLSNITFAAFVQSLFLVLLLFLKSSWKRPQTLLFSFFMLFFSFFLLNCYFDIEHIEDYGVHFPIWFAMGPTVYFYIRFSLKPRKHKDFRWLIFFIPYAVEVFSNLIYFLSLWLLPAFSEQFLDFHLLLLKYSFGYSALYVFALIPLIFSKKTIKTISVAYNQQKTLIYFVFASLLAMVFAEITSPNYTSYWSVAIFAIFIFGLSFLLLKNNVLFSSENFSNTELLISALNEQHRAVVITDPNRFITYTNNAFTTMTGYYQREVLGKKPSLLQGKLTENQSITFIREQLNLAIPFVSNIINYRKNGEAYICKVDVKPIFQNGVLTHFVAFEEDLGIIAATELDGENEVILQKMKALFEAENLYSDKNLQIADVAERLDTSVRHLSSLLNTFENQTFSEFVNSYRVRGIINALQNPDNEHLTIEAISQQYGFNSKSAFHTAFKKVTGTTPKAFLQVAA